MKIEKVRNTSNITVSRNNQKIVNVNVTLTSSSIFSRDVA